MNVMMETMSSRESCSDLSELSPLLFGVRETESGELLSEFDASGFWIRGRAGLHSHCENQNKTLAISYAIVASTCS